MTYKKMPLPEGTTRIEIGRRLRLSRESLGITPTEICREIGMRRTTYSMNELGENLPNVYDMIRLCSRYGLTLEWIYRGDMSGLNHAIASEITKLMKDKS